MFRACQTPPKILDFGDILAPKSLKNRNKIMTTTDTSKKYAPNRTSAEKRDYFFLRNAPRNPRNLDLEASWDPWRDLWCFRVLQDTKITSKMVPGTSKIHKKLQKMY